MIAKKDLSKTYQSKTPREHILDAPDTYIGSTEQDTVRGWMINNENDAMVHRSYDVIPGLFKCFDEGIVNARDHYIRLNDKACKGVSNIIPVRNIEITVDKKTGRITMYNDGNGIDVAKHPDTKLWVPEMIFGHLRTSTNYNKEEKKVVGGKNGFGFKLVLIYATEGSVETYDHIRKKKYIQHFGANLSSINKPVIRNSQSDKKTPYTKVSWIPDYKRFGIDGLTEDLFQLFKKRTYDISVITNKTVKVKFNGETINLKSFENYIDMYIGTKDKAKRIYEKVNNRWELCVSLSPLDEFTQVSFVNGINTKKGGKHVDYILNQITKKMVVYIEKKKKVKVKPVTIKEQLMLFINCQIENPGFDSQTKEYLTTKQSKFGSKCEISDKFIDKLAKMGVMENAISLNEIKDNKAAKKNDGRKVKNIRGIPKYMNANFAGGTKSYDCTLILCEGDSAKAGIISGLSKEDRNYIGVFPLKGKLLNTKDTRQSKINNNAEITNIKKILGLVSNKKYVNVEEIKKTLRYGKILIMTDQDLDGSHIKGLCLNLFHTLWEDLLKTNSFIGYVNTPILKARKGSTAISFYNEQEYQKWKGENDTKGWKIKYYKGLGTSTSKEFKEYFKEKKQVIFQYGDESSDSIDKVFNKHRADDRKTWLENYEKDKVVNINDETIKVEDFIDREMIHFSKYDCERSLPSAIDGLKISTRKILYAALKRKLYKEIKVAQFSGYVSEHSGYHHGEMSLQKAIIGMAQEFVGSNNINLLLPNGQFGSRLKGGKDAASERYIFTLLNKITEKIFRPEDMPILKYLNDDGFVVEPEFYKPIIPYVLVNGGKGIGTGFAYDSVAYNPKDIIKYLIMKLEKQDTNDFVFNPYYEGFQGSIVQTELNKFMFKGVWKKISYDTIQITELPIGVWSENYKEFLESLMVDDKTKKKKTIIKNYKDSCTDTMVDFTIKFQPNILPKLLCNKFSDNLLMLEKVMKLYTIKTNNMQLFNKDQKLNKYMKVEDIIEDYLPVRYQCYEDRKKYQLAELEKIIKILSNKARFIKEQCDNTIDLRRKKSDEVNELLKTREYDTIDNSFKYLISMPISSLITENIDRLLNEKVNKETEYQILMNLTIEDIWIKELKELANFYKVYIIERKSRSNYKKVKKSKKNKKVKK
jgi:DNA topoisomerase II